ncbi:MAG TPA: hypothetical protein VGN16_14300 [Acidobacteriaceae bacterium]
MDDGTGIWTRRKVLQTGCLAGGAALAGPRLAVAATLQRVALVIGADDPHTSEAPVQWAIRELEAAFAQKGVTVRHCDSLRETTQAELCILVAGTRNEVATSILHGAGLQISDQPESLGIVRGSAQGRTLITAVANDARGLMYAVLELADEVAFSSDALRTLTRGRGIVENRANAVRSMMRSFTSDVEDKPWFNDREMWPQYFAMLARQRFNRFNLAFGIGYDFIRQVTDAYFLFTYPFLLKVPGYNVRATNLPDAERDANLAMLKYIAQQAVAHGLEFHVGLWMHGYVWENSPDAHQVIEGLDAKSHAPYCRDAVRMLLREVPEISGLTFRVHGESGVTEGSYDFWRTLFEGVSTCGRPIAIDMHTKGMDETMQNVALSTGEHVQMSPKYWGEHLGLPYHQADIRVMEQPTADSANRTGLMKLSAGTRSFLRYGYGDLLREDRKWSLVHRIWPGTQRVLLSGDPQAAAAYSRAFSFCGSNGVEIMEMLSFKGRRGSGIAGNRTAYADASLAPRWDWQKFEYTTAVWGRSLYNPEVDPAVLLRPMQRDFGPAAGNMSTALGYASRILPTVLTAYAPSAGNNSYWPELYLNETSVDAAHPGSYGDSPKPVLFHTASTFDPPIFSRMLECGAELLGGEQSGRYSPLDVASWLDQYAAASGKAWSLAAADASRKTSPAYRRIAVDVAIQQGLGTFFAERFRGGVLFGIYEQTKDARALRTSIERYKLARAAWLQLANTAKGVYMADITLGETPVLRGHWLDRIPAIDRDIAALESILATAQDGSSAQVTQALEKVARYARREPPQAAHQPAATFVAGQELQLQLAAKDVSAARLHYRHVDQAERYTVVTMERTGDSFHASIPAAYTDTEYPLQYFFQLTTRAGDESLFPGLADRVSHPPYYVVRRA